MVSKKITINATRYDLTSNAMLQTTNRPTIQCHSRKVQHPFCETVPEFRMVMNLDLQVQTLCSNNISSDLRERFLKLARKFIRAHNLTGLSHLSEKFFQAAEETDE